MKILFFTICSFMVINIFATQIKYENNDFTLIDNKKEYKGNLFVYDDAIKKNVSLNGNLKQDGGILKFESFIWEVKSEPKGRLVSLENTIENISNTQLKLEVGMILYVPRQKGDLFWGGFDVFAAENKPLKRLGFKGVTTKHVGGGLNQPFPTASLITDNKAFILGQRQFGCTSYNASTYTPVNEHTAKLSFSQRIVVEPKQKIDFHLALGIVKRRFDKDENVVQAFYDAFPENWKPFVGQDNPYIWGIHSHYSAWYYRPNREKERRIYATIDWGYTPFKRSGDCYGRKEFWDYKPLVAPFKPRFGQHSAGESFDYSKLTREEFHKKRKRIFDAYGRDFGYSFYITMGWCEINLAKENYPDALVNDKDVPLILGPWSTYHDRERRVFPYGNSYGDNLKKDIKQLTKELNLTGFAFDCGTPGVNHYGTATKNPNVIGKAWDDKGIFVDELVAVHNLIDYVHKLRTKDPLYIWKNGQGRGDYMMIETDLFSPTFKSWMPLSRYNIGQRPAVLHTRGGFMFNETIPNWRNLSREEFMKSWQLLAIYQLFSDFEYGMTESHNTYRGVPQSIYALPELLECIRNGWHALVPVEVNTSKKLNKSRYGSGANTILFYGNPYTMPLKLNFKVDNYGLGVNQGYSLFVPKMRDKSFMVNKIENGDSCFEYTLPSRLPVLFESVCSLSNLPENKTLTASISSEKDINKIIYTIKLQNKKSFKSIITPRWIYRYVPEITVDGKKIATNKETTLNPNAEIKITFNSQEFKCTTKDILNFPFTNKNKAQFNIQIPENPNDAEIKEANNLREYFVYTTTFKLTTLGDINIIRSNSTPKTPTVVIAVGRNNSNEIDVRDGNIYFSAKSAKDANVMMKNLNYVMDIRYPIILMPLVNNSYKQDLIKKFDLSKHSLPFVKCFEGQGEQ